jgi:hypothetical protein
MNEKGISVRAKTLLNQQRRSCDEGGGGGSLSEWPSSIVSKEFLLMRRGVVANLLINEPREVLLGCEEERLTATNVNSELLCSAKSEGSTTPKAKSTMARISSQVWR